MLNFEKQGVGFRLVDAAQTTVSQVVTEVTGAKPNTVDRETPEVWEKYIFYM